MIASTRFFSRDKISRMILSNLIIFCLMIVSAGVMAGIMYLRIYLNSVPGLDVNGVQLGTYIASFINSFQIVIGNLLFDIAASNLTEYENHRTDTEHEDNLVYKTFGFTFLNSYATLFYIAFAKGNIGNLDHCLVRCSKFLILLLIVIYLELRLHGGAAEDAWYTLPYKYRCDFSPTTYRSDHY